MLSITFTFVFFSCVIMACIYWKGSCVACLFVCQSMNFFAFLFIQSVFIYQCTCIVNKHLCHNWKITLYLKFRLSRYSPNIRQSRFSYAVIKIFNFRTRYRTLLNVVIYCKICKIKYFKHCMKIYISQHLISLKIIFRICTLYYIYVCAFFLSEWLLNIV